MKLGSFGVLCLQCRLLEALGDVAKFGQLPDGADKCRANGHDTQMQLSREDGAKIVKLA